MPPRTLLARRAELLSLYTGLGHQRALQMVEEAEPGASLIPPASTAQAHLEHQVLSSVSFVPHRFTSGFPWGIRSALPHPDGSLTLELDGDKMAAHWAGELLPRRSRDGDIYGVPGLRCTSISAAGIVLSLVGTKARVTLTGVHPQAWRTAVASENALYAACGLLACHRRAPSGLTTAEHTWRDRLTGLSLYPTPDEAAVARTGSGLLRRVGLLRTVGVVLNANAYCVSSWSLDLIYEALDAGPIEHEQFLALLTAPNWGLPLTPARHACHHPCRVTLSAGSPREELRMAFYRRSGREAQEGNPRSRALKTQCAISVPPRLLPSRFGERWLATGSGAGQRRMSVTGGA
ncbi:hypothetical protein ACFYMW_39970 [Streptomyces sp. NPDC006692]|uniref:hypothetical protein n=1 Tax=unclassified Streptomyces TaxID=2593676 RepID=UPI0036C5C8E3